VLALVAALVGTPAIATAATPTVHLAGSTGQVEPNGLSDPDEFERRLDETTGDRFERHRVPGAAVVVNDGGRRRAEGRGEKRSVGSCGTESVSGDTYETLDDYLFTQFNQHTYYSVFHSG
jgi:hypothetical protein